VRRGDELSDGLSYNEQCPLCLAIVSGSYSFDRAMFLHFTQAHRSLMTNLPNLDYICVCGYVSGSTEMGKHLARELGRPDPNAHFAIGMLKHGDASLVPESAHHNFIIL